MSTEEWTTSAQLSFGDEFGRDNVIDAWPTSSQSPGISPQPSPDSQLLDPAPLPVGETSVHNIDKSGFQQSSFISQSNQPAFKDGHQIGNEKKNFSHPGSHPASSFNRSFPVAPSPQQPRPRPVSFPPNTQHRFPPSRNLSNNTSNSGLNPGQPIGHARPPPPLSQHVRPMSGQPFTHGQGVRQPHVQNQNFRPQQSSFPHPNQQAQQRGNQPQQHQQHHHPSQNTNRQQQNPQAIQNQNSPTKTPHPQQPYQNRQNPQFPNQHLPARPASQTHPGGPNNPRMPVAPSGGQRPRMMMGSNRQPGPNPNMGRGMPPPRPNTNSFVRPPHPANINTQNPQGNLRFPKQDAAPSGPMRPGVRLNMPRPEMDPFDEDYDDFDEENEDMYYDEDDDDDDFDEANEGMYNHHQQQQMPFRPPVYDEHASDDSDGSDEDQMLLEEMMHCQDDERYEMICMQLREKGVSEEEMEEYKANYSRHYNEEEMDFDEDEMDEDEEEEEEEMVSSSSMGLPKSGNNPMQQQQLQQPPPFHNRPPPVSAPQHNTPAVSQEQIGNHPPPSSASSGYQPPFSSPGPQQHHSQRLPGPGPRPPHPTAASTPSTTPQHMAPRKPQGGPPSSQSAISPNAPNSSDNNIPPPSQSQQAGHQPKPPGGVSSTPATATYAVASPRPGVCSTGSTGPTPPNTAGPRAGPPSAIRMPTPASTNASSSHFTQQSNTPNVNQSSSSPLPPHNTHHPAQAMPQQQQHSDHTGFPMGQQQQAQSPGRMRPPIRHGNPGQGHHPHPRFSQHGEVHSSPGHTNTYRMAVRSPQAKGALLSSIPPSDARLARQTVQQMQKLLDAEIQAKKRPQSGPSFPHRMGGNPGMRAPTAVVSPMVRHKLPPRTPIPHMPGTRPLARPFHSGDPQQQAMGGHPRFQGLSPGPPRPPRHPHHQPPPPASSQYGMGQQGPNRFNNNSNNTTTTNTNNNPIPAQSSSSTGVSNNFPPPPSQQQTMATSSPAAPTPAAARMSSNPAPVTGTNNQTPTPAAPNQPVVRQTQQPQQQQQQPQQQQPQQQHPVNQNQQQQTPGHSIPSPQGAPKADTFNLGGLSADKCIVKGQQQLVTNMLYQIRSPIDQKLVLARWNGERFEDLNPNVEKQLQQAVLLSSTTSTTTTTTITPSPSSSASTPSSSSSVPLTKTAEGGPEKSIETNSGNPEDARNNQSTFVKPMPEAKEEKKHEEAQDDNEDDAIFKKPFNDNEDYYRVCKHCGYTSKNFKRCEGCRRIFQGEVKIHQKKKAEPVPTSSSPNKPPLSPAGNTKSVSKLDGWNQEEEDHDENEEEDRKADPDYMGFETKTTGSFYGHGTRGGRGRGGRRPSRGMMGRTRGGGLKGRAGYGAPGEDEYDSSDSEDLFDKPPNSDDLERPMGKKRAPRGRGKGPVARKRAKKVDEPVTVMISSDEDEPSSTSNNFIGLPPVPSPASSAGSGSPIFPSASSEPSGAFGRFRRARMEDEQGNSKLGKKMEQMAMMPMGMEDDEEEEDDEGDEPPTYQIEVRSIRVGSMRTKPEGPLFINMRGVCFRVKSERADEMFECEIMSSEVEHVKYYGGQGQPVLFFLLTQECGEKLRSIFHMEEGGDEYLDPCSTDMKQKMVVIIIESLDYLPQDMRETLSLWADINHMDDEDFIEELSEELSNDLLIQSAPPVLTAELDHHVVFFKKGYMKTERSNNTLMPRGPTSPQNTKDNEPDSTSSSPPQQTDLRTLFEGPPIRLLQYPPLPARGIGITTEDLFCLNEGEFLNDVIIDFYLQYLHQEMLTEEMRKRTHIFSSFFYKRLTQKDRHSEKTEEDAKKSLPERRHARVRKWTKHVDLFSKDFLIVPINEHSHWYLAVVCFPGLATPEVVPFIPSPAHTGEMENDSPDRENPDDVPAPPPEEGTSGTSGGNSQPQQPSLPENTVKTVFGKQLDPDKCDKSDESSYCLGQKLPCILIFDSLLGPSRNPNVKMLREYLQCEWNAKKSEPRMISKILRGSTPKVPQQSNYSDCGIYLLQYVESLFEDPIADYQIPMKGLQQWFMEDLIVTKREEIHNLIMKLHRRYQEERGDPNILDIKYDSGPPPPPIPHAWGPHPPTANLPPHEYRPLPLQDQSWPEDSGDGLAMAGVKGQQEDEDNNNPNAMPNGADPPPPPSAPTPMESATNNRLEPYPTDITENSQNSSSSSTSSNVNHPSANVATASDAKEAAVSPSPKKDYHRPSGVVPPPCSFFDDDYSSASESGNKTEQGEDGTKKMASDKDMNESDTPMSNSCKDTDSDTKIETENGCDEEEQSEMNDDDDDDDESDSLPVHFNMEEDTNGDGDVSQQQEMDDGAEGEMGVS